MTQGLHVRAMRPSLLSSLTPPSVAETTYVASWARLAYTSALHQVGRHWLLDHHDRLAHGCGSHHHHHLLRWLRCRLPNAVHATAADLERHIVVARQGAAAFEAAALVSTLDACAWYHARILVLAPTTDEADTIIAASAAAVGLQVLLVIAREALRRGAAEGQVLRLEAALVPAPTAQALPPTLAANAVREFEKDGAPRTAARAAHGQVLGVW